MLVGFGCTVPAIMAARTLESTRDRILTIFMTPFMSCGARLPVYALFGAAFFGVSSGLVVFSIYLAGAALAILTGLLMKNTRLKGQPSFFIMELPPYHAPRAGAILRNAWSRLSTFIIRAGKVIVLAVAVLGILNSLNTDGTFGNKDAEHSVLSAMGMAVTPVFEPMGIHEDNWPATVALFTGLFAKEAVVGTLNSLYAQVDPSDSVEAVMNEVEKPTFSTSITQAFMSIPVNLAEVIGVTSEHGTIQDAEVGKSVFVSLRKHFTDGTAQVYAYMLFVLLYMPCMAAMGAVVHEIGRKMALILAIYLTTLAWIVSTLVYQIGFAHNLLWIGVAILLLVCLAVALSVLGWRKKHGLI
jgi:ferrous iron transport protein B